MRLARISARCGLVVLGTVVALASATSQATPITNVVYGNLGPSGTAAIDNGIFAQVGSSVLGNSGNRWAIPFTTGTSDLFLNLKTVVLGLSDSSAASSTAILQIVGDSAGTPTGSLVASTSLPIGAEGLYSFDFSSSNVWLTAGATYWVTLAALNASAPEDFFWLRPEVIPPALTPDQPSAQNGSGYILPASGMRSQNGGAWTARADATTLSMAITAVPEPPTYALAAAGLGLAGLVQARRRKGRTAAV